MEEQQEKTQTPNEDKTDTNFDKQLVKELREYMKRALGKDSLTNEELTQAIANMVALDDGVRNQRVAVGKHLFADSNVKNELLKELTGLSLEEIEDIKKHNASQNIDTAQEAAQDAGINDEIVDRMIAYGGDKLKQYEQDDNFIAILSKALDEISNIEDLYKDGAIESVLDAAFQTYESNQQEQRNNEDRFAGDSPEGDTAPIIKNEDDLLKVINNKSSQQKSPSDKALVALIKLNKNKR